MDDSSDSVDYTTEYQWEVQPLRTAWTYSDSFFIKNLNVAFSLAVVADRNKPEYCIKLTKYPTKQGAAMISLSVEPGSGYFSTEKWTCSTQDWIKDLKFRLGIESHSSFVITCKLTWNGFVEEILSNPHLPNHLSISSNHEESDITIIINGKKIPAHKSVLAIRSPKFLAMINSTTVNKTKRLKIDNITAEIMKKVLTFIYTGELIHEDNIDLLLEMLAFADDYELKHFKIKCEIELYKLLTIKNVLRILKVASLHNTNQLYQDIVDFIALNLDEISQMNDFKKLNTEKPEIFVNIVSNFAHYYSFIRT